MPLRSGPIQAIVMAQFGVSRQPVVDCACAGYSLHDPMRSLYTKNCFLLLGLTFAQPVH